MELTELSLAPTQFSMETNSSSSESENKLPSRKRKFFPSSLQTSVDLHVRDPLPIDWEQCLDLESGKKYYLNRRTSRKSWNWPKDQKLDLELNINSTSTTTCDHQKNRNPNNHHGLEDDDVCSSNSSNMVALACLNCHLLVILSKSSPACPNCKYVHSLPSPQPRVVKSLNTLSLLN